MLFTSKFLLFYTSVLTTAVCVSLANFNFDSEETNVLIQNEISFKTNNDTVSFFNEEEDSLDDDSMNDDDTFLHCSCTNITECYCCASIRILALNNSLNNVCINLKTLENKNAPAQLITTFVRNNIMLFAGTTIFRLSKSRSSVNVCIPVPAYEIFSMCIKVDPILQDGWNVRACVHFKVKYSTRKGSIGLLRFYCVSMGLDAVGLRESASTPRLFTTSKKPFTTYESCYVRMKRWMKDFLSLFKIYL